MEYERPLFYHVMSYAADADRDVVDLVSGSPDWEPPAALRDGLREYADAEPDDFQYPPSAGLRGLRAEIAARRNVDVDRVVVTNGAAEANYLAMAGALDRFDGASILLTDPVYPYYPGKTELLGATQHFVDAESDGSLDPDAVRAAADEDLAAIVVNTPNNPTGAVYDRETMVELAEIAVEHDALLISDEVYDHYDYTGRFESALTLADEASVSAQGASNSVEAGSGVDEASVSAPDESDLDLSAETVTDHVAVTNAFSKSMAITGFRVGYCVLPPAMLDRAQMRHMLVNVSVSRPAQRAVLRALRETDAEYYQRNRERMTERIETFTTALDAAGADYTRPDGGFYVLARFEGFPGTLENVKQLVDEAGVAGMPGEAFGESRDEWLRFALVTPRVAEAAQRLTDFFAER